MPRKKINKITKMASVGAMLLALSGCEVIGLVPMAMYGASLEVDRMLERREIRSEIQDLEDRGVIPKIDETDTRAGIDSDNNGIRDDVDAFIKYKAETEKELFALKLMARGFQVVQEAEKVTPKLYESYYSKTFGGWRCLELGTGSETFKLFKEMTANTRKRANRQEKVEDARQISVIYNGDCPLYSNSKARH